MEHLKALCDVLDLSIDEAVRGRPSEAVTGLEGAMLETLRALPPEQGQALLALASSMVKKAEKPSDQ